MSFSNIPRPRKEPMSTEEYLRSVFKAQESSSKNRDYTPRTVQPDGSMDTEDFLREVVFGVERPPARPVQAKPVTDTPTPDPQGFDSRTSGAQNPGLQAADAQLTASENFEAIVKRTREQAAALLSEADFLKKENATPAPDKNAVQTLLYHSGAEAGLTKKDLLTTMESHPDRDAGMKVVNMVDAADAPSADTLQLQRPPTSAGLNSAAGTSPIAGGGLYAAARTAAGRIATDAGGSAVRQPANNDKEFWGDMSQKLAQSGLKTVEERGTSAVDANAYKWAMGGDAKALEYLHTQAAKYPDDAALQRYSSASSFVSKQLENFKNTPWRQKDMKTFQHNLQESIKTIPGLSNSEIAATQQYASEYFTGAKKRYTENKPLLVQSLSEDVSMSGADTLRKTDDLLEDYALSRGGIPAAGKTPAVAASDIEPKRTEILGEVTGNRMKILQKTPEGRAQLQQEVTKLDPYRAPEMWKHDVGPHGNIRSGLSDELLSTATFYADKHGVPLTLALMILSGESNGVEDAKSGTGARGRMQLTTSAREAINQHYKGYESLSMDDPEQNIELGMIYLKMGLDASNGDWLYTMIYYNSGEGKARDAREKLFDPKMRQRILECKTSDQEQLRVDLGLEKKENVLYVSKQVSRTKLREPEFALPESSIWHYLPADAKKTALRGMPAGE